METNIQLYSDDENFYNFSENSKLEIVNNFIYPEENFSKKPECLVVKFEKLENLIAAGYTNGKIVIYERENKSYKFLTESIEKESTITSLRWKPHNSMTSKNILLSINTNGEIIYWHVSSGKIFHKLHETNKTLLSLDYSFDGTKFAVGNSHGELSIYDENIKIITHIFPSGTNYIPGHTGRINCVCFNKYEHYENVLVSGGWDRKVIFYDLRSNKISGTIKGPYIIGDSMDFKDNLLLTASNNKVKLWDIRNYSKSIDLELEDNDFTNSDSNSIFTLQFSRMRNYFAYGGSSVDQVKIYNFNFNDDENKFKAEATIFGVSKNLIKPCYSLDFSISGKYLVFGGGDSNFKIIDI